MHVDATPDANYPLRILRAYRKNCDCRYVADGDFAAQAQVWKAMNDAQEKRAAILDAAIEKLSK